jgi:hypothetical protein
MPGFGKFRSGSINAPLVGEDFYRRRNLTRVTDEPEVIPGKKSLWRKRGVRTRGVGPDLLEARFWGEAHVQEADFPSKWTRAGTPRAQFLVSGETAELSTTASRAPRIVSIGSLAASTTYR